MSGVLLLWLAFSALAVASFAAVGAYALRDFSRSQLKEFLRERGKLSQYDEILRQVPRAALGAESLRIIAATTAVVLATLAIGEIDSYLADSPQRRLVEASTLVGGVISLWLVLLWLPGAIAGTWGTQFMAHTWAIWRVLGNLFLPSFVGGRLVERILHLLARTKPKLLTEEALEEEIREVVTEGQREGLLQADAGAMIQSVIALGEVQVSEIMTHRMNMISIQADMPWDDALQTAIASAHTRLPVYSKNRDHVVGILHIKDILQELARGEDKPRRPIVELVRPPFFVPETKPVDDLLKEFQQNRNHMAVVLDEYGGVSGLVTIEDVLEEIVGEIADEHDEAAADAIKQIDERHCEAAAGVHISEINECLGLHLPERPHIDTIGGFVFHELGHIPRVGETVTADGVVIKVLEATRRKISRVAIEVVQPSDEASTNAAP